MAKLWGGRFSQESSSLLEEFNASIFFDNALWREDIAGSKAHAQMLGKIGVLQPNEVELILDGLTKIAQDIEEGHFQFKASDEDIHMAIESALTECIGDVGKKLHTARSRNDQVALDFRLYVLKYNCFIRSLLLEIMESILNLAKEHTQSIMPGMTHLQHAQPVNFGFHLVAWACNFKRDIERLEDDYKRNNFCPLGSGALAGTPYGNDRVYLAEILGFSAPTLNAMDSVSDRDFALDMLYSLSMVMMHLSRVAEELVLWSTQEFAFITLSDAYATGSSIMPQKKNPDVPELLRGKSGRVYGALMGLLSVMKGLPLAYNKDTQEDKEGVLLDEYYWLNKEDPNYSLCRATMNRGEDAHTDGKFNLSRKGCMEIMKLFMTKDEDLYDKTIEDVFDEEVFGSTFWLYWRTMFAFENWHSALEMKLYFQRFIHHIAGLPDFSALKFTKYNQYESLILPMQKYLEAAGVEFRFNTEVTNVIFETEGGRKVAKAIECRVKGVEEGIMLTENDLVFVTNGSCTEGTVYGDQNHAPNGDAEVRTSGCWNLWKNIAAQDKAFGHPEKFCSDVAKTNWESATVTTLDDKILPYITIFVSVTPKAAGS